MLPVGLPIAIYPLLTFAPPLLGRLPIPVWLGLGNYLQIAGSFLALLGLILLVRRG